MRFRLARFSRLAIVRAQFVSQFFQCSANQPFKHGEVLGSVIVFPAPGRIECFGRTFSERSIRSADRTDSYFLNAIVIKIMIDK